MKIVHIVPSASYTDYFGYQDNLLPKYQKKLGHDVTVIATNMMRKSKDIVETECSDYVLSDGVRVIRRKRKKYCHPILTNLRSEIAVYDLLCNIQPDFIFFHGLVSATIYEVIRYKKKNPTCVVVQDNHLDYNIGRSSSSWKDKVVRALYRYRNRRSAPYVDRVYGTTPWRKTYAEDYFRIPLSKTDVLIMGADDEKIDFAHREEIRAEIRKKYGISDTDFLVVTGGKIDKKKKIDLLMQGCAGMQGVKLLIFGEVLDDEREHFDRLLRESDNVIYIGWIDSGLVYDYFFAADLVFFPGQHSVLWEQACAAKVPCTFGKWEGMEHVDNGGNASFIAPVTSDTVRREIERLRFTDEYFAMKSVANSDATNIYLYSQIAKKSLECAE